MLRLLCARACDAPHHHTHHHTPALTAAGDCAQEPVALTMCAP
jgi:hypothetical protein